MELPQCLVELLLVAGVVSCYCTMQQNELLLQDFYLGAHTQERSERDSGENKTYLVKTVLNYCILKGTPGKFFGLFKPSSYLHALMNYPRDNSRRGVPISENNGQGMSEEQHNTEAGTPRGPLSHYHPVVTHA